MAKEKEEITIGYDKDGNTCYFDQDGKIIGYAEDNCTAALKKDFKANAIKAYMEEEGMTKEEAERAYDEAYGPPEEFNDEDEEDPEEAQRFSTFKRP